MIAACARVGLNAPNGGDVGSLAGAMPGGRLGVVKESPRKLTEAAASIADFAGDSNDDQESACSAAASTANAAPPNSTLFCGRIEQHALDRQIQLKSYSSL